MTSSTLQTVTIKSHTPTDTEANQLRDVGTQVTKYIYNKVHAHAQTTNRVVTLYKDVFKNHKLILILPNTDSVVLNKRDIIELRCNIINIVKHAKRHDIDIEIQ